MIVSITLFTGGCGMSSVDMPFDPDTSSGSLNIEMSSGSDVCEGFASKLCVADQDVFPDGDIVPTATGAALFDINAKSTVIAKNANIRMAPASLTKVMTALLALKYGHLDDVLTASANVNITESGAQTMGLKEGDRMSLEGAIHGLLLYSANDCGVLVAEYLSGSVENFAELMNKTANELGATNTHFTNPHGLTDEEHYTTVYDLYLIFNEAMKYDEFIKIINKSEYTCVYKDRDGNEKTFGFKQTNGFVTGNYIPPEGVTVIGGKTGTTSAAGSCLILLSQDQKNNPFISVILHDSDKDFLYSDMSNILLAIP